MTIRRNRYTAWLAALLLTAGFAGCQQDEFAFPERPGGTGDGSTLRFISDPMDALKVTTRSSDIKDDDEKAIKQLYIFFFGSDGKYLEGTYLTGYPDAGMTKETGGFYAPGTGVSMIKIANGEDASFTDPTKAQAAHIYAVANVEAGTFPIGEDGRPTNIADEKALQDFIYKPERYFFTELPETGMPMFGSAVIDLTENSTTPEENRNIQLKALMARVDVSISINSDKSGTGQGGTLPALTLEEWTVKGVPDRVGFTAPTASAEGEEPVTSFSDDWVKSENRKQTRVLYNNTGSIDMTFYMFENMQAAIAPSEVDWKEHTTDGLDPTLNDDGYPVGTKETQYQLYKPYLAADAEHSAAVEIHGYYTTYNGHAGEDDATYEVTWTLYLGSNHTNNFQVERNHQYKNNVVIKGLTQVGTNPEHITFDARINIQEEANDYFISMLRERDHDAHFCVTPMDVYMFREGQEGVTSTTMEVILGEVPDGSETPTESTVPDWIRMEMVSSDDMKNGTLNTDNLSETTHCNAGPDYTAGHGKRKYFDVNLVTETLNNEAGKHVTLTSSRDRVYFYLDEYLKAVNSISETDANRRKCTVTLIYKENDVEQDRRTIQIEQVPLLTVHIDDDEDGYDIYIEQFEEYLQHYDPLNTYNSNALFEGIAWGPTGSIDRLPYDYGTGILNADNRPEPYKNEWAGTRYTHYFMDNLDGTARFVYLDGSVSWGLTDLNTPVTWAAQYCYNKGKRNTSDHYVPTIDDASGIGKEGGAGVGVEWYLPAIEEMKQALLQHYNSYPEFQNYFYWSSSAGVETYQLFGTRERENTNTARAVKVDANGDMIGSYENEEGAKQRGDKSVRIRAFRRTLTKATGTGGN